MSNTLLQQMGVIDGNECNQLVFGNKLVSYFQVESALLEYPNVYEAGIIAPRLNEGNQVLNIFLSLEQNIDNEEEKQRFQENVKEYIMESFELNLPTTVKIRPKLPINRSGKIMRTILAKWSEEA